MTSSIRTWPRHARRRSCLAPCGSRAAPAGILVRHAPDPRTAAHPTRRAALRRSFGTSARLWLFGSRTDDNARGGDYDLLVQTDDADPARLVDARLAFLAELHATPSFEGEKVDVVLYATALDPQPRPIHRAALSSGIELT